VLKFHDGLGPPPIIARQFPWAGSDTSRSSSRQAISRPRNARRH
jgi:hypothetical protein